MHIVNSRAYCSHHELRKYVTPYRDDVSGSLYPSPVRLTKWAAANVHVEVHRKGHLSKGQINLDLDLEPTNIQST